MSSFVVNLYIDQGASYIEQFVWKTGTQVSSTPIDLTGCTARMQIRESIDSPDVLLELSTLNGGITLGTTDGLVTISIPFEDTAAMTFHKGRYDLELTKPDGTVRRLMKGSVHVSFEVTR